MLTSLILALEFNYPKTNVIDLGEFGTIESVDDGMARPLCLDKLDETLNAITVTDEEIERALMDPALDDITLPFNLD